jgi:hypothetical protein
MIEVYNNISAWSEAHADAAAAVLKWMKAHDEVLLASTRYFGGDPLAGEPYGYAHFTKDNRAVIVVRNPSLEPGTITVPFDETTGMWPGDRRYVLRIVYPFLMALPHSITYGSKHEQPLAGHEVVVLEIWPAESLPEPMPIARRYTVESRQAGKTSFRLQQASGPLHVFSPVKVANGTLLEASPPRYAVAVAGPQPAPTSPAAKGTDRSSPPARPRIDGDRCLVPVRVPEGGRTRVAFRFAEPQVRGELLLDGEPMAAEAPHVRLPDAANRKQGTRAAAPDWSLFGIDVGPGEHVVQFRPASSAVLKRRLSVLLDSTRPLPSAQTVEIEHQVLSRKHEILLPQNWASETRMIEVFPLPLPAR